MSLDRKETEMEKTLKHRTYELFVWLYYIAVRSIVRAGVQLLCLIGCILAALEYYVTGSEFDTEFNKKK